VDPQEQGKAHQQLSASKLKAKLVEDTHEIHKAPWETPGVGEAGYFVEVRSRGGILGYSDSRGMGRL